MVLINILCIEIHQILIDFTVSLKKAWKESANKTKLQNLGNSILVKKHIQSPKQQTIFKIWMESPKSLC